MMLGRNSGLGYGRLNLYSPGSTRLDAVGDLRIGEHVTVRAYWLATSDHYLGTARLDSSVHALTAGKTRVVPYRAGGIGAEMTSKNAGGIRRPVHPEAVWGTRRVGSAVGIPVERGCRLLRPPPNVMTELSEMAAA